MNPNLWAGGQKGPDKNKAERHIRGGRATKIKYQMENEGTSMKTPNKRGLEKFMIKFISKRGFYADM